MRRIIELILLCLMISPPLYAADYRFERIDFPRSTYSDARGINARGDIVGGFVGADSVGHGYLLSDGQFTQIDFPGAAASAVLGINNAGDLTGSHSDATEATSGFIFKDGVFQDVSVPGSFTTVVSFAQDNGRVLVGQSTMRPDGGFHGFVRNKPGDFQLVDFPGLSVPCTGARWINQRGDIVGGFAFVGSVDECSDAPHHGFILRDGRYMLIDFPGATHTRALAINDDGVIVGEYMDSHGIGHGFKAVPRN